MAQNFLDCDRDQPLLLPPDLRDWLPEDHLAWFVIEAVEELVPSANSGSDRYSDSSSTCSAAGRFSIWRSAQSMVPSTRSVSCDRSRSSTTTWP